MPVNYRNRYLPPTSNSIPLDLNSGNRSNPFFYRIQDLQRISSSGSQGTQCVHQDFSSRHRHGYILAERIHVRILVHTGRILGSYLHDVFQPRHSSFVAMMQLENHMSQPCLTVSMYQIFGLFNLD
jgi:hypothetical protein